MHVTIALALCKAAGSEPGVEKSGDKPCCSHWMRDLMGGRLAENRGITESLKLEKTSEIIRSNHQPNTTVPAKPCPEVPHLHVFLNISRDGDSTASLGSLL